IHTMNRKFLNLLSSIKMYQDQVPSHVRNCLLNNSTAFNEAKKLFSQEFDSCNEYQFMEALRNHAQHGGHAVHSISFQANRLGNEDNAKNEFSIYVWCLKSYLKKNRSF